MDMTAEAVIAILGLLVAVPSTAFAIRLWLQRPSSTSLDQTRRPLCNFITNKLFESD